MTQISIMALRHSAFYTPLLMCVAGDFLKEQGLEPVYTLATPANPIVDSINNGSCDVAQSAVATGFAGLEAGNKPSVVHFAQINERDGFFIAGKETQTPFRWSSLLGKTILVDHLFQPLATLKYVLHQHGIDFSQLNVIDAGNVEQIDEAFRNGRADFVHQQGPAPQQLEKEGIGFVLASVGEAIGPLAFSSLCSSESWLKTEKAKAFMRAYRHALRYSIDAPADELAAKEIEAGFFPGIDAQVLSSTIEYYQQLNTWQPEPEISHEGYNKLLDIFQFNGLISQRYAYNTLIRKPPE